MDKEMMCWMEALNSASIQHIISLSSIINSYGANAETFSLVHPCILLIIPDCGGSRKGQRFDVRGGEADEETG